MKESDIGIIGGGIAGMSAAIYASRMGAEVTLFERSALGGQILSAGKIENYPGLPETDGLTLAGQLEKQIRTLGVGIEQVEVSAVTADGEGFLLATDGGERSCRALILATGAERRRLGVPGEERLRGRGVSWCAACDGNFFRGRCVAVAGGGNTALSEAVELSRLCRTVYLLFRSDTLRAEPILQERLAHCGNVIPMPRTEILEIEGEDHVTGLALSRNGRRETLAVDALFEAVGTVPACAPVADLLPLSRDGGIPVDSDLHTQIPCLFAVGDCRAGAFRQLVTAASDGARAGMLAASESGR